MPTQTYKHEVRFKNGDTFTVGVDGVRSIAREADGWVKVENGNGNIHRRPREDVTYHLETPKPVTLEP